MPRRSLVIACAWGVLALAGPPPAPAFADHGPPTAALGGPSAEGRHRIAPREVVPRADTAGGNSAGWWLGTVGVALALAAFGAVSLASRRFLPQGMSGTLQVVGRASLSPRHTV